MSRSGDVWANAAKESFFSTLKIERCYRRQYVTPGIAKAEIFDYDHIEPFYIPTRRDSSLGNLSLIRYEQAGAIA